MDTALVLSHPSGRSYVRVCEGLRCAAYHEFIKDAVRRAGGRVLWAPKLKRNVERDREADIALKHAGWRVLRVWEHEHPVHAAQRIAEAVSQPSRLVHDEAGGVRGCSAEPVTLPDRPS